MQFERRLSELIADVQLIGADDFSWPFVSVNFNVNVPYRNVGCSPESNGMDSPSPKRHLGARLGA